MEDWAELITPTNIICAVVGWYTCKLTNRMLQDALASSRTRSRRKDKINNQLYRIDQARCADDRRGRPSNDQRDFILNASAGELVRAMKDFGSAPVPVDATKVMQAFIQQSHDAHRAFNCLTEIMMTEALKQAWAIDDTSGSDSKENDANDAHGLLHGLPVSLKDCINVRGHDSTLGLTKACGEGDAGNVEDALIVTLLREAGAIPFVKTNVPQTMISFECRNPLFGTTTNPWNIDHTPGGSSGGEGCLLVARGSPLGFGTDIGGSVRIPAHFSGCCALKPTSRRVTKVGLVTSMPGQEAVQGVIGPMARCVDDLALAMRAVINERAWLADATLVPVPFKMSVYQGESRAQTQFPGKNGKPRIGYYVHDGFMPASPACARAVMDTVKALREGGYEVVEFAPPRVADGMALFYTLLAGDHGDGMIKMLEGEERESYVDGIVGKMRTIPDFVKDILAFVIDKYMGDKNAAALVTALKTLSVGKLWQAQAKRQQYCKEFHQSMLDAKVDVLVTPPHVLPAIEHGAYDDLSFTACYTILYNLLDLPAGVLPVSRVTADDTYAVNDNENVSFLEKKVRSAYDPVAMQGLPLGVQIIGRSFCDESVLSVMKDVEELLPFTDKPSFLEPGRSI